MNYARLAFLFAMAAWLAAPASAARLTLGRTLPPDPVAEVAPPGPGLLPHSTVASGQGGVDLAWLAGPTARYAHGVLGDGLESSRLVVRLRDGRELQLELPEHRVFEDLVPRLFDVDSDGVEEVVLVESDAREGASLAVYGVVNGALALRSRSPFIGRANRWLNPVGVGDFDGDGQLEIALIRTPHIGGVLEVYRYAEPTLELVASRRGYSTHVIGSTELGLGGILRHGAKPVMVLPNQQRNQLALVELRGAELVETASVDLPATLSSSLWRYSLNAFGMSLDNGLHYYVITE